MSNIVIALLFGAPFVLWAIAWWFSTAATQASIKLKHASERARFSTTDQAAGPTSVKRTRGPKIAFGRR